MAVLLLLIHTHKQILDHTYDPCPAHRLTFETLFLLKGFGGYFVLLSSLFLVSHSGTTSHSTLEQKFFSSQQQLPHQNTFSLHTTKFSCLLQPHMFIGAPINLPSPCHTKIEYTKAQRRVLNLHLVTNAK